jgi:hypothetical protein
MPRTVRVATFLFTLFAFCYVAPVSSPQDDPVFSTRRRQMVESQNRSRGIEDGRV